jgi:acetyl-CoA acyltransferase 1
MGWTAENVAGDFGISRQRMDEWALKSHNRAEKADASGVFADEIAPVVVPQKQKDGSKKYVEVTRDDGIRPGTTAESLAKVRAAFPQWAPGHSTGGNASQITDGGAFVLMMTRRKAQELGLPILAKHVATVVAGLAPRIMGIGPAYAIPKLFERTGLGKEDVDLFEINEAFSSMMVYCIDKLGLDGDKVNVNGGAIALGHPFGCTGARQVATGLNAIKRTGGKVLVTSMCIGSGMGAAAAFINEQ